MLIRKIKPATAISFTYATSGSLSARCLTHPCQLKRATTIDQHHGGRLTEKWELTANVSDAAVGQEFLLGVEVTYWNAFDTPEKQWYSSYSNSRSDPEDLAVLLLFPEDRPFQTYQLLAYPHNSSQGAPFSGTSRIVPGEQNRSLYWEVFSGEASDAYEIHWTN